MYTYHIRDNPFWLYVVPFRLECTAVYVGRIDISCRFYKIIISGPETMSENQGFERAKAKEVINFPTKGPFSEVFRKILTFFFSGSERTFIFMYQLHYLTGNFSLTYCQKKVIFHAQF